MKKVNDRVPQSIQHKICLPSVRLLIASRRSLSVSPPSRITCKQVWTHSKLKATMLIHRSLKAKSFYQPKSSEYQNCQCMYRYWDSNTINYMCMSPPSTHCGAQLILGSSDDCNYQRSSTADICIIIIIGPC